MLTKDTRKGIDLLMFGVIICFCSCKHSMNTGKYLGYIHDDKNGLLKAVKLGDWEFDMQYKPYDYILFSESKGGVGLDKAKRSKELQGTAWFNISFKRIQMDKSPMRYNISSQDEYNQRLNYYLNGAPHDIELVYGTDTLKPMSYLFETNYNLTPQETMVVGFELPATSTKPEKDMQLVYYDRVFGNGIIKATYAAKALNNIPDLIF